MKTQNTHLYKKYSKKVKRKMPALLVQVLKGFSALLIMALTVIVIFPNDLLTLSANLYESMITKLDFKVEEIKFDGSDKVPYTTLKELSGITLGENIMLVDILAIKGRMEKHPWIESVIVERVLPGTILVSIKEEYPQAVYVEGGKYHLINRNGKKLQETSRQDSENYLKIIGLDANLHFDKLLEQLYNFQNIYKNIDSIHYIDGRRWDIKLKSNFLIKLPEGNIYEASVIFEENFGKISKLYNICVVDLRLIPDKIYLKVIN